MNLWTLFPEALLQVNGILFLPYVGILFYFYVFFALVKHSEQRICLAIFVLLTVVASGIMLNNLGPGAGKIVPPLSLFIVMAMPVLMVIIQLIKKSYIAVRIWSLVTLAGLAHSISWSAWLFAMARS